MSIVSRIIRIIYAVVFGIMIIAFIFSIFPRFGGESASSIFFNIFMFILILALFIYNLVCLIIDSNIIFDAIANLSVNGGFWSGIGNFFIIIGKGIYYFFKFIIYIILAPFVLIPRLVKKMAGAISDKKTEKRERKIELENREKRQKELEIRKKEAEEHEKKMPMIRKQANEEKERIIRIYNNIWSKYSENVDGLKMTLEAMKDEYIEAQTNLRKFIVSTYYSLDVHDVQAAEMFDNKNGKFVGSEKYPYVNTKINDNDSDKSKEEKKELAKYVEKAESLFKMIKEFKAGNKEKKIKISKSFYDNMQNETLKYCYYEIVKNCGSEVADVAFRFACQELDKNVTYFTKKIGIYDEMDLSKELKKYRLTGEDATKNNSETNNSTTN